MVDGLHVAHYACSICHINMIVKLDECFICSLLNSISHDLFILYTIIKHLD